MSTSREIMFLNAVNTCTHFCIGGIVLFCCIFAVRINTTGISSSEIQSFSVHIVLCVLGYALLMTQAVMSLSNSNNWSTALSYDQKKTAHWVMQVVGSVLATVGIIIRITGRSGNNNFDTGHGVVGLITLIMTILSLIGGVANIYLKKNGNLIKTCHALAGCATLIFAFITLIIGMDKDVFRAYAANSGANTLISFAVIALIGVLSSACLGVYRRIVN